MPLTNERKLLFLRIGHFCRARTRSNLFLVCYIATKSQNLTLANAMYAHYPWIITSTVLASSWLLLWAAGSFREKLFKDYRIPRIRFDTHSNGRINTLALGQLTAE
ncbi:hypothetical protein niasHT_021439 [Heterodera trifolii]|uniref:Uncharacterized protein n=1 Tax=Heterodera trifolii TaxID=157864 RepID=A0ABD2KIL2_9BILA